MFRLLALAVLCFLSACSTHQHAKPQHKPKLKALIIDGQNNHTVWPKSTMMMQQYLEETGLFAVDIQRTATTWKAATWSAQYPLGDGIKRPDLKKPEPDPNFAPNFADYDVVISNFGWKASYWPRTTQVAFEDYMKNGGGFVVIHAADNSYPTWREFNKMIGLGGWGKRSAKDGPYVYFNEAGELIRDTSEGRCGSHGPKHEFLITLREEHPITKGMPREWMHTKDELYAHLRGPAENMTILASAYSAKDKKGTGRHEPMMMVLNYGKGRIFHSTLGHEDYSMEGVGFITTLTRGAEWAATGAVSQPLPADFPTATNATTRRFSWRKAN